MISNRLLKDKILRKFLIDNFQDKELVLLSSVCSLDNLKKTTNKELPYLDVKYLRGQSDEKYKTDGFEVNAGDYVILVDGENSGEVFEIPCQGYMGSTFKKLKFSDSISKKYIMYYISLNKELLKGNKTGSAIPHLNKKLFASLQLYIPSIEEQEIIVEKIDEIFSLIEEKEKNDQEKAKLKEVLKEKILNSAIHGELVKNDSNLKSVDVSEVKNDILYEVPQNWIWTKMSKLGDITSSKRVFQSEWKDSGVPFYRARDIISLNKGLSVSDLYISEEMYEEYSKKYGVPNDGDILLTGVGTIGESYVVKSNDRFYFKDGNIIWLKKNCNVNSMYLKKFFESKVFKNQVYETAKGATVLTLTIVHAKDIMIPIPPLEEQNRIVEKIESLLELIEQL